MTKEELIRDMIKSFQAILYNIEEVEIPVRNTLFDKREVLIKINIDNLGEFERALLKEIQLPNKNPMFIEKLGTPEEKWKMMMQDRLDYTGL
jgi:hypothetical protein